MHIYKLQSNLYRIDFIECANISYPADTPVPDVPNLALSSAASLHSNESDLTPVASTPVVDYDTNSGADDSNEQFVESTTVDELASPSDQLLPQFREILSIFRHDKF